MIAEVETPPAVAPPRAPRVRRRWLGPRALVLPALALVGLVFFFPIGKLFGQTLFTDGGLSLDEYRQLFSGSVFETVLWRTVRGAAIVTLIALALGYPVAYTIARVPQRWAVPLLLLVMVPFFSSVLIRSYALTAVLSTQGIVNDVLRGLGLIEEPLKLVFNTFGAYAGMVQIMLPIMVLPLYSVMRTIDRATVRAAQSLGASPLEAFWLVFRPLSLPGVAAGCSLVFLISLGFYVTPALLGGPGQYWLAEFIETRVFQLADIEQGATASAILLAIVVLLLAIFRRPLGLAIDADEAKPVRQRRDWAWSVTGPALRVLDRVLTPLRRPLLGALLAFVLLYLVAPQIVVVVLAFSDSAFTSFPPRGFSLRWFDSYFGDPEFVAATWRSVLLAGSAALCATFLGAIAAVALVRGGGRLAAALFLALLTPLIVPQVVFGVSYFSVFPGIPPLLSLLMTYTVLGLPYAILIMSSVFKQFDRSLEHAASSLGASAVQVFLRVTLPVLRPAFVSSFVLAFLVAFDDVIVSLFLASPDTSPLSLLMWLDVRFELTPRVAAISTVLLVPLLVFISIGPAARRGRRA
jgi:putative spermidine/putrescine transport system permease protein